MALYGSNCIIESKGEGRKAAKLDAMVQAEEGSQGGLFSLAKSLCVRVWDASGGRVRIAKGKESVMML